MTARRLRIATLAVLLLWPALLWAQGSSTPPSGIRSAIAGGGLTGGGTTPTVTFNAGAGLGIVVNADDIAIDPTYTQRRVTGVCTGNAIASIAQDGTVTCTSNVVTGSGASGSLPIWTGTTILDNSDIFDDTSLSAAQISASLSVFPPLDRGALSGTMFGTVNTSAADVSQGVLDFQDTRSASGPHQLFSEGITLQVINGDTNLGLNVTVGDVGQNGTGARFTAASTVTSTILSTTDDQSATHPSVGVEEFYAPTYEYRTVGDATPTFDFWDAATDTTLALGNSGPGLVNVTIDGSLKADGTNRVFDLPGTNLTRDGTNANQIDCPNFASGTGGCVPASGGGTTNFLRADGSWAPATGGGGGNVTAGTLTTNTIPKASGATAIANSLLTDDAATLNYNSGKLTVASATGNTAVAGTLTADAGNRVFDAAGNGITATGNSIAVNNGTGLIFATGALTYDNAVIQSRVSSTCTAPQSILSISATGTVTCTTATATTSTGTTNTIAKYSSAGNIANSDITDNATTVAIATENMTVTHTGTQTSAFSGSYTGTAQTVAHNAILASNSGTYNTTAGALIAVGLNAQVSSARSSGANNLINRALYASATNGQTNIAIYADAGDVLFNQTSGTFTIGASKVTVDPATGNTAVAGTLTADTGNRVFDTVGTGLARDGTSANQVDLNMAGASCAAGTVVSAISATGTGTCTADVTSVVAGTGIATSTTSGAATISLATVSANTIMGNNTAGVAAPTALTPTQTTAMLDVFTSALKGLAPASGGGTTNFLRADGSWATPAGAGNVSTGTLTANQTVKASGATSIVNAWAIDDGTTWGVTSKFTITEASGNTAVNGTLTADAGLRVFDAAGTGLTSSANSVSLAINGGATQTCGAGTAVTVLTGAGITTCTAFGTSSLTNGAGNNIITKSNGTNLVASGLSDDGTTISTSEAVSVGALTATSSTHGLISPAALSAATVNDWLPTGLATAKYIIVTPFSSTTTLTGIDSTGFTTGHEICLQNNSATIAITLAQATNSAAANQFHMLNGVSGNMKATSQDWACFMLQIGSGWYQVGMSDFGALTVGSFSAAQNGNFQAVTGTQSLSIVNGTGANTTITAHHPATALTASGFTIVADHVGSYNTTAGALTGMTLNLGASSTRSAGTNTLTDQVASFSATGTTGVANLALELNASGGAVSNTALKTDAGDLLLASTSGNVTIGNVSNGGGTSTVPQTHSVFGSSTHTEQITGLPIASSVPVILVQQFSTMDMTSGPGTVIAGQFTANTPISTGAGALTSVAIQADATSSSGTVIAIRTGFGDTQFNQSSGNHVIGSSTFSPHMFFTTTTTKPTVANCGTTPTVVGDDIAGFFTTTATPTTSCALTFHTAYTANVDCEVWTQTGPTTASPNYTTATTGLTGIVTAANAALASGVKVHWFCYDH